MKCQKAKASILISVHVSFLVAWFLCLILTVRYHKVMFNKLYSLERTKCIVFFLYVFSHSFV